MNIKANEVFTFTKDTSENMFIIYSNLGSWDSSVV